MRAHEGRSRAIGTWGTAARLVVGLALLWLAVTDGTSPRSEIGWWEVVLGLVVFPGGLGAVQLLRARREPTPLRATGVSPTA